MEKLFKIVKDNKKSLRKKSVDIKLPLDKNIKDLAMNMLEYLRLSQDETFLQKNPDIRSGVGLAAPQIGQNINLIALLGETIDSNNKVIQFKYLLVNPKIISESNKKTYLSTGEGCLSVDKAYPGYVYRSYKIIVSAYSVLDEKQIEISASGYLSIVLQHEIDHLNGILFYDRINKFEPFKKIENSIEI